MVHLDLDSREADILSSVLQSALSDLGYEISNTDLKDYREKLKERRVVLEKVTSVLAESRQPA